jgi:hypothetical protein
MLYEYSNNFLFTCPIPTIFGEGEIITLNNKR